MHFLGLFVSDQSNCSFFKNAAGYQGGAITAISSTLFFDQCLFLNNEISNPFSRNDATTTGGMLNWLK